MTYIIIFITAVASVICLRNRQYFNKFSLIPYRVVHNREWYRVISHGFVHADYVHLIVNMLVLLSFGQYLEQLFKAYQHAGTIWNGSLSFLLLYFGGMIAASIYDIVKFRNNPHYASIGASGAVAAIVFASIFFHPWNKIYFFGVLPIPGIVFGVLYIFYCQYMSKRERGVINHNAHLYGSIFGFIYPMLMDPSFIHIFLQKITEF